MTTTSRSNRERSMYEGDSWEYFLMRLQDLKPASRKVYLRYLIMFFEDNETNPDEYYNKIKEILENTDTRVRKKLAQEVRDYYVSLVESQRYKVRSLKNFENAIKNFLHANELYNPITKEIFEANLNGEVRQHSPDAFKVEQVDKATPEITSLLLQYTHSSRLFAQILTLRDTGLRVSDLVRIQVKHIQSAIKNEEIRFHTFEILPEKNVKKGAINPMIAHPVLGFESLEAIRIWLKYGFEKWGIEYDDPEQYVFYTVQNKNGKRIGDQQSKDSVTRNMRYAREKANMEKQITPHSFRAMHSTNLLQAMPKPIISYMQGRRDIGSMSHYVRPTDEELIEYYKNAYHTLSTMPETQKRLAEELRELKDVVRQSDVATGYFQDESKQLRTENNAMREEMDQIKTMLAQLMENRQ